MKADFINVFTQSYALKATTGILFTIGSFFFDPLLAKVFLIVLVLTLIDCMLGYIRAFMDKSSVVSRAMRRYMWKFVGYVTATSSLFLMNNAMPPEVQFLTSWLDSFALAFFAIHETISIIEHLNELGVPMPSRLLENLKKVRDHVDKEEDRYEVK